jgi:hypothetical protein
MFFVLGKQTYFPAKQTDVYCCSKENTSSCSTRKHLFLSTKNIGVLAQQEHVSRTTTGHLFMFNSKTLLLDENIQIGGHP